MLLKDTININAVDGTGKTALAVAMERGFERAAEFLISSGACVDLADASGQAVFLHAIERAWLTVANLVVEKAVSASAGGQSALPKTVQLLVAAYRDDAAGCERLAAQDALDLRGGEERHVGATALFVAVEREHLRTVRALLAAGVDVNVSDSRGQTVLHRAARRGSEATLRFLLEHGSDVNYKDDDGRTAWSANARSATDAVLRILRDAGADPNTQGPHGITELYEAAAAGDVEYVKRLLKWGTNPSIRTRFGWAPLHWAANNGYTKVVRLLIDAGADLSPVSDQGTTPLDCALASLQTEVIAMLTRAGARKGQDLPTEKSPGDSDKERAGSRTNSSPTPTNDSDSKPKRFLEFDEPLGEPLKFGQYIYYCNQPDERSTYWISHPLNTTAASIGVRRDTRFADNSDYPLSPDSFPFNDALFEIVPVKSDYQALEIRARAQCSLPGTVRLFRSWTGSWEIRYDLEARAPLLFRATLDWSTVETRGYRWTDEQGNLLARTGWRGSVPMIILEPGMETATQDCIVACWIAKLWSDIVSLDRRER
jgi:ankyrin repeat protein